MKKRPGFEHAERIAFATSEPSSYGARGDRWTELAVYFDHKPMDDVKGRPWIAIARGCSTYAGESTREELIRVGTLERALKLFDEGTQLGRSVRTQAEDWRERHVEAGGDLHPVGAQTNGGTVGFRGEGQEEALQWLYGRELDKAKPQTLLARDFGVKESTARMQMAAGRPIMVPLAAAVRFLDRAAFRREREANRD